MEELADKAKAPVLHGEDIKDHRCLYRIPHWLEIEKAEGDEIILKPKIMEPPKDFNDCLFFLGYDPRFLDGMVGHNSEVLNKLQRLIVCRDAYWEFAGNWKPDWKSSEFKYCLKAMGEDVVKGTEPSICCILAFPTEELRDAFWDNFKDLIVECKELL